MLKLPDFTQGDSIEFESELSNYPHSSGWSLSWVVRGPESLTLNAIAVDGTTTKYKTTITADQSQALTPGNYFYSAVVINGIQRVTVLSRAPLTVSPDLATLPDGYDFRSTLEKQFDEINAAISALVANPKKSYRIHSREMEFTHESLPELIKERDKVGIQVAREKKADRIRKGLDNSNFHIRSRFRQ